MGDSKPRVSVDCDGVLADFVGAYLGLLYEYTGIVSVPSEITNFDIGASLGLTPAQSARMKRAVSDAQHFARNLEVYPGAIDGMTALHRIADVYVVTSPWNSNRTWTYDRERWLAEHFGIPHSRVVHTSAKHLCVGDALVDDKTETLVEWQAAHPTGIAVQWATPHNALDRWDGVRIAVWPALIELVGRMRVGRGLAEPTGSAP